MSPLRRAVAAWLRRTEPRRTSLTRVRARLDGVPAPAPREAASLSRRLLQAVPDPAPVPLARVRRRLVAGPVPPRAPALGLLEALAGAGALAATVAAALVFVTVPVPLDGVLEGDAQRSVTPLVEVAHNGRGTVGGTEARPRLTWEWGTLAVEVAPDRGADVEITTPEAHVRVVGTAFTVTRDRLGTTVAVARGTVDVTCAGEVRTRLPAGQTRTCLPTRAAGLLGRAQAMLDADAPPAEVLDAVDRGLALATGPVRHELLLARLETLVRGGRDAEALSQASALLADPAGDDEAPAIRRLASTAARRQGGCGGLRGWLEPLPDAAREPLDLVALADCTPEPARARQLLETAATRATDPRQADAIQARLLSLHPGAPK